MEKIHIQYEIGDLGNYDRVKELRKGIVYRRDDFTSLLIIECRKLKIKVFCSAFEADWQLIAAQEHAGLIDIIVSDDGDLFVIGGDIIVTELNYYTGSCCFYERKNILSRPSMGNGSYADELPALSSFLRNDFVKCLDGNGSSRTRALMDGWVKCSDSERHVMITTMEVTRKWHRDDEENAHGFSIKFWQSYYLQKYAPIFRLTPTSEKTKL